MSAVMMMGRHSMCDFQASMPSQLLRSHPARPHTSVPILWGVDVREEECDHHHGVMRSVEDDEMMVTARHSIAFSLRPHY